MVKSDIEIAQASSMALITDIASKAGISSDDIEQYGKYKAKITFDGLAKLQERETGKLPLKHSISCKKMIMVN